MLVFSTYFGGSASDQSLSVTLDSTGNIYFCGVTGSSSLHGTNIGQPFTGSGSTAAFVAKVSPAGALLSSTYIAGGGDKAFGSSLALDSAGNIYLSGNTSSPSFPTKNPIHAAYSGNGDAFILEMNNAGTALLFSSYFGGSGLDYSTGTGVDSNGNIFLSGTTESTNFPVVNAVQSTQPGTGSAYAVKLAPGGASVIYSTYIGGNAITFSNGLAVDHSGNLISFGDTGSTNFPVLNALQPTFCGWQTGQAPPSYAQGWVTVQNPSGGVLYSTYICGVGPTGGSVRGAKADPNGNLVITGETSSTSFPTLNPVQASYGGGTTDAFVMRLSPAGSMLYSTYLGGNGEDQGRSIDFDPLGNIYIVGDTYSSNFPTYHAMQGYGGNSDGFFTKLNAGGSAIALSTYIGGNASDTAYHIAADNNANAYIAGFTASSNFPTYHALQPSYGGGTNDAFLIVISTCDFTLSQPGAYPAAGASGSVTITTTPECGWTVSTAAPWLSFTSPVTGQGSGSISYTIAANTGALRTATVAVANQSVTLTQLAGTPVLSISLTNAQNFTQGQTAPLTPLPSPTPPPPDPPPAQLPSPRPLPPDSLSSQCPAAAGTAPPIPAPAPTCSPRTPATRPSPSP